MVTDPKEKQVDKILAEDQDSTMNPSEITRIIRLYLGREATPDETSRFNGMMESEKKILIDYVNSERNTRKAQSDTEAKTAKMQSENEMKNAKIQSDTEMKTAKVQGDLMTKGMKTMGENTLNMMKNPPMPATGPMGMGAQAPMASPMSGVPVAPGKKYISDGRFVLVKFQD